MCVVFASFQPSTATSRSLQVKERHFWDTSGHPRSRDVIFSHVTAPTASYSLVGSDMCSTTEFSAFYSHFQVTSVKRHLEVTLRHLGSRDVISCHVTASYCELLPCRK